MTADKVKVIGLTSINEELITPLSLTLYSGIDHIAAIDSYARFLVGILIPCNMVSVGNSGLLTHSELDCAICQLILLRKLNMLNQK